MSKSQFIESVARRGHMSKANAKRVVEIVFTEIQEGVKNVGHKKKFPIGTLGTFFLSERKERRGRNPRTGELIRIKASHSLKFRPSLYLKKAAGVVENGEKTPRSTNW